MAITLNTNLLITSLQNMIIGQVVEDVTVGGNDLVDKARNDIGLFGDQKLYYAGDALSTHDFKGARLESPNLLQQDFADDPKVQSFVVNVFRQIRLTTEEYISKQAWSTEGVFGQYMAMLVGTISKTKKIYEATTYNAFIGTVTGASTKATVEVALSDITASGEEKNRLEAQMLAKEIANLLTEMNDYSTDFNDYQFLRRYAKEDLIFVFNSKFVNAITYMDLPTIFHNDGLIAKLGENVLPSKYFGEVNAEATVGNGSTVRSLIEQEIEGTDDVTYHYWAGDLIKTVCTAPAGTSYTQDDDIICKVFTQLPPFLTSPNTAGEFYNQRGKSTNHYLNFGHNTLQYFKDKPLVTLHAD